MDYENIAKEFLHNFFEDGKVPFNKFNEINLHGERAVLISLKKSNSTLIAGDIASQLGVSTARVAVILKCLEKKGLVKLSKDNLDKRKTFVELTNSGVQFIENERQNMIKKTSKFFESLGKKDTKDCMRILLKTKKYIMERIND